MYSQRSKSIAVHVLATLIVAFIVGCSRGRDPQAQPSEAGKSNDQAQSKKLAAEQTTSDTENAKLRASQKNENDPLIKSVRDSRVPFDQTLTIGRMLDSYKYVTDKPTWGVSSDAKGRTLVWWEAQFSQHEFNCRVWTGPKEQDKLETTCAADGYLHFNFAIIPTGWQAYSVEWQYTTTLKDGRTVKDGATADDNQSMNVLFHLVHDDGQMASIDVFPQHHAGI